MTDEIIFAVPLPPASLRGNSRAHWARRSQDAVAYSLAVYECVRDGMARLSGLPWREAEAEYVWRYSGARPDIDNIARGVKALQDTLCSAPRSPSGRWYMGIIADDGGIEPVTFRRQKVARRTDEGIDVWIRRVQ